VRACTPRRGVIRPPVIPPAWARATGPGGSRFSCGIRATRIALHSSLRPLSPHAHADETRPCRASRLCPTRFPETFPSATSQPVAAIHWSRCLIPRSMGNLVDLLPATASTYTQQAPCSNRHDEKGRSLTAFATLPPGGPTMAPFTSPSRRPRATSGEWARKTSLARSSLCSLASPGHTDAARRDAEENKQRLKPRRLSDCETSRDCSRPCPVCGRLGPLIGPALSCFGGGPASNPTVSPGAAATPSSCGFLSLIHPAEPDRAAAITVVLSHTGLAGRHTTLQHIHAYRESTAGHRPHCRRTGKGAKPDDGWGVVAEKAYVEAGCGA
jgi:hypothetical protein